MINLFAVLCSACVSAQASTETPPDELIAVELEERNPLLGDRGPSKVFPHTTGFSGTLFVWAASDEVDPYLRIEHAKGGVAAEDDDSGGGTTSCIALPVEPEQSLNVIVASSDPKGAGKIELHLIAAPETEATRAYAGGAEAALSEIEALRRNGEPDRAREILAFLVEDLEQVEGSERSALVARVCRQLGLASWELGDLADTYKLFEAVHAAWERLLPPDHPDLLATKLNFAATKGELGDIHGALELFETVNAARERLLPPEHPDLLTVKQNLAVTKNRLGDLAGALELLEIVHTAWERVLSPDHPDLLTVKQNLAMTKKELGDLAGALELEQVVHAARERLLPPDHPDSLTAKQNLAGTKRALGNLAGALELFEVVHAARERLLPPDHSDLLRAKGNLAGTKKELGDLAGALELFEVVHAAWERLLPPDHSDLLRAKANLAGTKRELGDLAGALELLEVVHAARERLLPTDHPDLLAAKLNLAVTKAEFGDLAGALELLEVVYAARERLLPTDHPDLLAAKLNLAGTKAELGDLAGALELLEVVHAARERLLPPDHPDLLAAKLNLAGTKRALGNLAGALELLETVHAARERLLPPDHPGLLAAKLNLAFTKKALGDVAGALSLLPCLLEGMSQRISGERVLSPREAWAVSAAETDRLSQVLFLSQSKLVEPAPLVELIETRRLVSTSGPSRLLVESSEELLALRQKVAAIRRELGELISGGPASEQAVEEWRSEMSSLWQARDEAERACFEILKRDPTFIERVKPDELAAVLNKGERAVGFLRYERRKLDEESRRIESDGPGLLAMVVHPDETIRRIELGPADEIEALVARWRAELERPLTGAETAGRELPRGVGGLQGKGGEGELEAGKHLRRRILDPLLEGARTLYVCPDDVLHLVPLDALPLDEGERVGDRYQIRTEVSFARLLVPVGSSVWDPSFLVLGDVDFDAEPGTVPETSIVTALSRAGAIGSWRRLPGTADEVSALRALFDGAFKGKAVVLTRGEASKSALTNQVAGKRYLHLATHGWFAPETILAIGDRPSAYPHAMTLEEAVVGFAPLGLCGLCLAGANHWHEGHGRGLLTAEELAGLDLSQCDLAVLSACETNVGRTRAGLGIQSLQAALHAAGARTAITSLWTVEDVRTKSLMVELYTNLWMKRVGKAEALWAAKKEMRARGYPVSAWAGWVLTGEPD